MKRLVIFLLIAALTLGGCTIIIDDGDVKSTTKKPRVTTVGSGTDEPSATTLAPVQTTSTEPAQTTGVEPASSLSRGVWSSGVYTSDYAGLTFTMPSGWRAFSDAELAEKMGVALELITGSAISLEELNLTTLYDMMVINEATGDSVVIMFENLEVTGALDYSISQYIDALKTQLDSLGVYSGYGEPYQTTVSGRTYSAFSLESSAYNMSQTFYLRRKDKYMLAIFVTAVSSDTAAIMVNFS